jgi:hypothetical protein
MRQMTDSLVVGGYAQAVPSDAPQQVHERGNAVVLLNPHGHVVGHHLHLMSHPWGRRQCIELQMQGSSCFSRCLL